MPRVAVRQRVPVVVGRRVEVARRLVPPAEGEGALHDAIVRLRTHGARTYGARTNDMFDTGRERDYILSHRKPYYLIRMIPFGESWAESETDVAFPSSVMQKPWLPGDPMPADLIDEIVGKLAREGEKAAAAKVQAIQRGDTARKSSVATTPPTAGSSTT